MEDGLWSSEMQLFLHRYYLEKWILNEFYNAYDDDRHAIALSLIYKALDYDIFHVVAQQK